MKILLFDPDYGAGITQASLYLRDYLSQYHHVDMISWTIKNDPVDFIIENFNGHDLILIHDKSIDIKKLRSSVSCKIAYFIPGIYPHNEGIENIRAHDYVLSPSDRFHSDYTYEDSDF